MTVRQALLEPIQQLLHLAAHHLAPVNAHLPDVAILVVTLLH
jgi:hypothetical protein